LSLFWAEVLPRIGKQKEETEWAWSKIEWNVVGAADVGSLSSFPQKKTNPLETNGRSAN
jgi:hypothetical protein